MIAKLHDELAVLHGFLTVRYFLELIGEKHAASATQGIKLASKNPEFVKYLRTVAATRKDCTAEKLAAAVLKVYGAVSGSIYGKATPTFTLLSSVPAQSFISSIDIIAVHSLFMCYGPGRHVTFTLHNSSPLVLPQAPDLE
jgi:hypothetical protein